jgi:hypothetical protein
MPQFRTPRAKRNRSSHAGEPRRGLKAGNQTSQLRGSSKYFPRGNQLDGPRPPRRIQNRTASKRASSSAYVHPERRHNRPIHPGAAPGRRRRLGSGQCYVRHGTSKWTRIVSTCSGLKGPRSSGPYRARRLCSRETTGRQVLGSRQRPASRPSFAELRWSTRRPPVRTAWGDRRPASSRQECGQPSRSRAP